jgi:hypothetical protein
VVVAQRRLVDEVQRVHFGRHFLAVAATCCCSPPWREQTTEPMDSGSWVSRRGRERPIGRQPLETTGQLCQIRTTQRNHGNRRRDLTL